MTSELYLRPESHEIDTLARRQVPRALPAAWEHRETTGRDYGIDLHIELFDKGNATGLNLLLQIKGTSKNIREASDISFDVPVTTLKYSELFVAPVLLAFCPVYEEPAIFYFLWLQEYIRVVLDFENPQWRNNTSTVRVKIPTNNKIPGNERKIKYIASFSNRLFGLTVFARLLDEILHDLIGPWSIDHAKKALIFLMKIQNLKGVFDESWPAAMMYQDRYINPTINAITAFLDGEIPDENTKNDIPFYRMFEKKDIDLLEILKHQIRHVLDVLPIILDETNYSLKHIKWEHGTDIGF